LSAGLYLRDQIRLEAAMDTPSADLAARMVTAYEAKRQTGQVWVSAEGAKVRYIEIVDASRMKSLPGLDVQTLGTKIAPLIQALAASGAGAQSQSAAAPKPSGAIVIQGLAGGPKELPKR
jgi:hypothetical protein